MITCKLFLIGKSTKAMPAAQNNDNNNAAIFSLENKFAILVDCITKTITSNELVMPITLAIAVP